MNDVKTKHIGTTKGSEEFRHSSQGFFNAGSPVERQDGRSESCGCTGCRTGNPAPAVPFLQQITRRVARPANCDESPTGSYKQTPTAQ